jgi:hypothetical protein
MNPGGYSGSDCIDQRIYIHKADIVYINPVVESDRDWQGFVWIMLGLDNGIVRSQTCCAERQATSAAALLTHFLQALGHDQKDMRADSSPYGTSSILGTPKVLDIVESQGTSSREDCRMPPMPRGQYTHWC